MNVLDGMQVIQEKTCINFIPKEDQDSRHHIKFIKSKNGCGTSVGYHENTKKEPQVVAYSEDCLSQIAAIEHELLHVLGLFHEQSRYDRDEYVDIFWENIEKCKLFSLFNSYGKYQNN